MLTNTVYRYTKAIDLTNNEMGYGEALKDVLCSVQDGKLSVFVRTSQRTKTGRQPLYEQHLPGGAADLARMKKSGRNRSK